MPGLSRGTPTLALKFRCVQSSPRPGGSLSGVAVAMLGLCREELLADCELGHRVSWSTANPCDAAR